MSVTVSDFTYQIVGVICVGRANVAVAFLCYFSVFVILEVCSVAFSICYCFDIIYILNNIDYNLTNE